MSTYTAIKRLDEVGEEIDGLLDSIFTDSGIPINMLRDFIEGLEHRLGEADVHLKAEHHRLVTVMGATRS